MDDHSYLETGRVIMELVAPSGQPADPRTQDLSYAAYDPTYYIEIFEFDAQSFITQGLTPEGRALELDEPNPNSEMVSFAASLDQKESGGDGLGAFFAEKVHLRC